MNDISQEQGIIAAADSSFACAAQASSVLDAAVAGAEQAAESQAAAETVEGAEAAQAARDAARDDSLRLSIAKCLQSLGVPVKQTQRRGAVSLYVKQCDHIATVLTAAGAHQAVTTLESIRVQRQVLGAVNRAMNCDSFNLQKQMDANQQQLATIARLMESDRLATLPPALQEVARARVQNPDLNLTELGQALTPPVGKSGVNHRMRRLLAYIREEYPPEGETKAP